MTLEVGFVIALFTVLSIVYLVVAFHGVHEFNRIMLRRRLMKTEFEALVHAINSVVSGVTIKFPGEYLMPGLGVNNAEQAARDFLRDRPPIEVEKVSVISTRDDRVHLTLSGTEDQIIAAATRLGLWPQSASGGPFPSFNHGH